MVLLGVPGQEIRRGGVGQVVPALGAQHGDFHLVVQAPQSWDVGRVLGWVHTSVLCVERYVCKLITVIHSIRVSR